MLKITPATDETQIVKACADCGVTPEENALCYLIYEDAMLTGVCLFKLTTNGGRLLRLQNRIGVTDTDALLLAGYTCLEFIGRTSGGEVYFEGSDTDTAKRLGFSERDGRLFLDLRKASGKCGSCHKASK